MVSIIIPVYNPGGALGRCLESVLGQEYADIEVIAVNDGSTDGSGDVCREYAARDGRVVYVEQANGGVSSARNRGLEMARGEYVAFVDSDDAVEPGYVGCMVRAAEASGADLVVQGLKSFRDGALVKEMKFSEGLRRVSEFEEGEFDELFHFCGPYCKLFRTSVIRAHGLKFPTSMAYGEDAVFYHGYLELCRAVYLLGNTEYLYTMANAGSLSSKTLAPEKFWLNQHNRRREYKRLRRVFGLPEGLSDMEVQCKLIGASGMLNAVFSSGADDRGVKACLEEMNSDVDFDLGSLRGQTLKQRLVLGLVRANTALSRRMLKMMYNR